MKAILGLLAVLSAVSAQLSAQQYGTSTFGGYPVTFSYLPVVPNYGGASGFSGLSGLSSGYSGYPYVVYGYLTQTRPVTGGSSVTLKEVSKEEDSKVESERREKRSPLTMAKPRQGYYGQAYPQQYGYTYSTYPYGSYGTGLTTTPVLGTTGGVYGRGKRSAELPVRVESAGYEGQPGGFQYLVGQGYQGLSGINRGQLVTPVRVGGVSGLDKGVTGVEGVNVKYGTVVAD